MLTNKAPYKLALAKSQGSFSRMISSFLPSLGWHKIKEWLCYNFGPVATKQHAVSMLIGQQQTSTETLQEYIKRFLDLLLKSSGLVLHQAKDLFHIIHFICHLCNNKLQHYVLGKNPTSVQNAITLVQRKDMELHIIEGLQCVDSGHEINNINNKQNDQNNMGSCHACSSPHLVRNCNESICNRCRPNLDNHTPAKCIRKRPLNRQQKSNPPYSNNSIRG